MPDRTFCPAFAASGCVQRPAGASAVSGNCVRTLCPRVLLFCTRAGGVFGAVVGKVGEHLACAACARLE
eukprot:7355862-Alexandrium_andersonii.AAC.1